MIPVSTDNYVSQYKTLAGNVVERNPSVISSTLVNTHMGAVSHVVQTNVGLVQIPNK
jgi:hypothetical protein